MKYGEAHMKTKRMVVALVLAMGLFATCAAAQHEEHEQGQAAQPADKTADGGMGCMMCGPMMGGAKMGGEKMGDMPMGSEDKK